MSEPVRGPGGGTWQRLQTCRPVLSPDRVSVAYAPGGRDRVIVRNELTGTHVRVTPALWRLVERLDGRVTLAECLDKENAERRASDRAPLQRAADREAIAGGVMALERAGLLDCRLADGVRRRGDQAAAQARRRSRGRWVNPLALRMPLHDPDRWLDRLQPALDAIPARAMLFAFSVLLILACGVCLVSLDRLLADVQAIVATPQRWWTLLLVWPLLKGAHELAHALVTRRLGGRVHEVGIAFLVLMPMPYVDASDAWLFPRRRDRMLVSAAGMLAELALAGIAVLLWSVLEAGVLRDLCLAIVLAGAVSTILFNANPLLRFDGYYLLQDAIDVPNLAARSSGWWIGLARWRLLGLDRRTPDASARERCWLAGYGAASLGYRYLVMVAIAWWLLETLPLVGVPLALYALWPLFARPIWRLSCWMSVSTELTRRRRTAALAMSVVAVAAALAILTVPFSSSSRVTGVVRDALATTLTVPEQGELVSSPAMRTVLAGEVIARVSAPDLLDEAARLQARIAGLDNAIGAAYARDALEVRLLRGEREGLIERAGSLAGRIDALAVRAPQDGRFVPSPDGVLRGQHLPRGASLGELLTERRLAVRAVVREHQFAHLRRGTGKAFVRLAEAPLVVHEAHGLRESPVAGHRLPSVVLAGAETGGIAVAADRERVETMQPVFEVEIELPADVRVAALGGRAFVTFQHPSESLARRWWRGTRQLFLERLNI